MSDYPLPGDFGVLATHAKIPSLIRWATESPVNHAVIYTGNNRIVEAQPGGATNNPLTEWDGDRIIWSTGRVPLTDTQRLRVINYAQRCIGVPYGWLDIAAIALAQRRLGRRVNSQTWWVKRLASNRTLICSQLVDQAYRFAGVNLFDDGRLPGLVSPGDLFNAINNDPPAQSAATERKAA